MLGRSGLNDLTIASSDSSELFRGRFGCQTPCEHAGLDSRVTVAWAESSTGIEHMASAAPQPVTQVQVVTPRNESPAPEEGVGETSNLSIA